jgi:uncharacterized ion transporter superfamily protein YfcC
MKKHNLFKTLAIVLLIVMVCSYFISSRGNDVSFLAFKDGTASYLGFGDIAIYFVQSFYHFFDTIVFVLAVGAFYGVLSKVSSYKTIVNGIASKFKKNGFKFIVAITIIFALVTSLTGIDLPLFIFVPFVVAIIIEMRYDKLVALSSTIGGILVGTIGGIFTNFRDPSDYYSVSYTTFDNFVGLDSNYATLVPRIILLILGLVLLIYYIRRHIKKVNNKDISYDLGEKLELFSKSDSKIQEKVNLWPLIIILGVLLKYVTAIFSVLFKVPSWYSLVCNIVILLLVVVLIVVFRNLNRKISGTVMFSIIIGFAFVLLVLGLTPWSNLFNITFFDDVHSALISDLTFGEFSFYESVISSNFVAFGSWGTWGTFLLAIVMLMFISLIIKLVYNIKFDELLEGAISGIKKIMPAAVMVALAYTVLVCSYNNGFLETVITACDDNVVLQLIVSVIGSIFSVDLYYTVSSTFSPILSVVTDYASVMSVAFQSIFGLVQLIGPTSLLLVIGLTYFDVPYRSWVKYIWRFVLMLFIIVFAILLILALI